MTKAFFRTVLGDIEAEKMGFTYAHEHTIIDHSFVTKSYPEFLLNDVERISDEMRAFYNTGGRTVVDTMPVDCGRNVVKLAEVSRNSNVNIIAPTGLHLEIYYPENHWRSNYKEDQLTDLFIADIEEGIDRYDYSGPIVERTNHKAGMIKLATGDDPFSCHQEKIFRTFVNAHLTTGAPILTHTNNGKLALEQAELFEKLGAKLNHVVISHLEKTPDVAYHKAVLETGVRVEYDSTFRWIERGNDINWTLYLIEQLITKYPDQITTGMDMAKRRYWKCYGGKPGLNYLIDGIPAWLSSKGLEAYIQKLFYDNSAALYSFFT